MSVLLSRSESSNSSGTLFSFFRLSLLLFLIVVLAKVIVHIIKKVITNAAFHKFPLNWTPKISEAKLGCRNAVTKGLVYKVSLSKSAEYL